MVKVALVVSIIALAVCLLTALHGVLSDGLKGLKQRSKPIGISFLIYAVAFLLFIFGILPRSLLFDDCRRLSDGEIFLA